MVPQVSFNLRYHASCSFHKINFHTSSLISFLQLVAMLVSFHKSWLNIFSNSILCFWWILKILLEIPHYQYKFSSLEVQCYLFFLLHLILENETSKDLRITAVSKKKMQRLICIIFFCLREEEISGLLGGGGRGIRWSLWLGRR